MDLSLSGQTSIHVFNGVFFVFKSLLGIERQKKLRKKIIFDPKASELPIVLNLPLVEQLRLIVTLSNFGSFHLFFLFRYRAAPRMGYFPVRVIPFGLQVSFLIVLLYNLWHIFTYGTNNQRPRKKEALEAHGFSQKERIVQNISLALNIPDIQLAIREVLYDHFDLCFTIICCYVCARGIYFHVRHSRI